MERNKAKPGKSMKYWLFSTNPFVSISFSSSPGFFFLNFFPCHFWTCDYSLMRWHIADTYLRGCGRKRLHRIVITDRWKQDIVWLRMWGGAKRARGVYHLYPAMSEHWQGLCLAGSYPTCITLWFWSASDERGGWIAVDLSELKWHRFRQIEHWATRGNKMDV